MGQALEQLRQALDAEQDPTLNSIGGLDVVLAAADELPSTAELPVVVALALAEWTTLPDRPGLIDLIATAVGLARPFELDDVLDMVLSDATVVPDLAARLEEPLKHRAAGNDAAAGIALEAWLRLSLGHWIRPLAVLAQLDAQATAAASTEPDALDPTFLQRLVRCLGAAGEHWREHSADMAESLRGLLHHTAVDDDVAFELGMLELRSGLESADPQRSLPAFADAREHLALSGRYEDRIDAEVFGMAIDTVVAFVHGAVPARGDVDRLKDLVLEYRLHTFAEHPHWRQPRADAAVQWLTLVDTLAELQDLDRGWYDPAALIASMAVVYRAHRTLRLVQPAGVVNREHQAEVPADSVALSALLQPRLIAATARHADGPELLERWLNAVERISTDPLDTAAIRDIRERVMAGGAADHPKADSADLSALTELLGLPVDDAAAVAAALSAHPNVARKLNVFAAARNSANTIDASIYLQEQFARIRSDLMRGSGLTGERAMRVEQIALALVRYLRFRGSVTAGSSLAASYQRPFTDEEDAPKETEFADDLHVFLAACLPVMPYKEVRHIANGRVDLICFFGVNSLVVECKRELHDASMEHLASLYAFQPAEYGWADPGVTFLAVLDLTKETRRVSLGEAIRVVQVPAVEAAGRPETVMVAKVQANLPSPSYQSTPAAARGRVRAGVAPTNVSAG